MTDRWRVTVTHNDGQAYSFYSYKLKVLPYKFMQSPHTVKHIVIEPDTKFKSNKIKSSSALVSPPA